MMPSATARAPGASPGGRSSNAYVQWYQQNKLLIWGACAAATAGYATYRCLCQADDEEEDAAGNDAGAPSTSSPSPAKQQHGRQKKPSQLQNLRTSISNYSSAIATLSSTACMVATDLQAFLTSDVQEVPRSLRQITKLVQSQEVQDTMSSAVASVVRGVSAAAAAAASSSSSGGPSPPGAGAGATTGGGLPSVSTQQLLDTLLEALLSDRGQSLVGVAVSAASRSSTAALCDFLAARQAAAAAPPAAAAAASAGESGAAAGGADGSLQFAVATGPSGSAFGLPEFLSLLMSEQGQRFMSLIITKSIHTAVKTYVDGTMGYNYYDDVMTTVSKPQHRDAVVDISSRMTGAFVREVAAVYRKLKAGGSGGGGSTGARQGSSGGGGANGYISSSSSSSSSSGGGGLSGYADAHEGPLSLARASSLSAQQAAVVHRSTTNGLTTRLSLDGCTTAAAGGPAAPPHKPHMRPIAATYVQRQGSNTNSHKVMAAAAAAAAAPSPLPLPPQWLQQVVELARHKEVRSLAVDVVTGTSREATRGAVEGLLQGARDMVAAPGGTGGSGSGISQAAAYRLYMLGTLAVSMVMYAISPKVMIM